MLDLVLKQAEQAGARKVERVNINIGEMTGVVDSCVEFYFELLSKGTAAEGATVSIKSVPVTVQCRKCERNFQPKEGDWNCPGCGNTGIEILTGRELILESIEVE